MTKPYIFKPHKHMFFISIFINSVIYTVTRYTYAVGGRYRLVKFLFRNGELTI